MRMPTFYVPHGAGPCFFMDWNPPDMWVPMATFLKGIAGTLPGRPRAILLVSGHWETRLFVAGSNPAPQLIYDYYGFPPHTYQLTYPARGSTALARDVVTLLAAAGLGAAEDPDRGYDHGVFIPLKLMFPDADIPVVQLSLRHDQDAAAHLDAGAALAGLRDEGVLIVGSGMSFHNMAGFRDPAFMARAPAYSRAFAEWLEQTIMSAPADRREALAAWDHAPAARLAHPAGAAEHLLPLMVATGAAGNDAGQTVFDGSDQPLIISGFRFG